VTVGGRSSWDAWLVSGAAGVAAARALHSAVPNGVGRLGSLLETFLP
jgi:vancomycin resistance protein VanJ